MFGFAAGGKRQRANKRGGKEVLLEYIFMA